MSTAVTIGARSYDSTLPEWLQALASEAARPALVLPNGAPVGASSPLTRPLLPRGSSLIDGRFHVVDLLGAGGMGAVYRVHDHERDEEIALKTLLGAGSISVCRFKEEFRALVDVVHPNLVALHELFHDRGTWFYTMELIEGVPFDSWVSAAGNRTLQHHRLREAMSQLVAATQAIHAAGKLHRDLKPTNVLVAHTGRVVVLDYGLAVDRNGEGVAALLPSGIAGTPFYMAPEQAAGGVTRPASDAYSIGVILYQALTGTVPFAEQAAEIIAHKQASDPPEPANVSSDVPADLNELCVRLLQREPSKRITLNEAALLLRGGTRSSPITLKPAWRTAQSALQGRDRELGELRTAFDLARHGRATLVSITGESGAGKSALAETFLARMRSEQSALVLGGRSFERESVPFKAFDPLVYELTRFLLGIPRAQLDLLLPREWETLAILFPVLLSLAGRREGSGSSPAAPSESAVQIRRQAFSAFGQLIARITESRPVVLHFDDLQWSDEDSLALLIHLVSHARTCALLVILGHRNEVLDERAGLGRFYRQLASVPDIETRALAAGPLSDEAACAVLRNAKQCLDPLWIAAAGGNPLLLQQLAYSPPHPGQPPSARSMGTLVRDRVASLSDAERRLLEVIAVAAGPVDLRVAAEAAGVRGPRRLFTVLQHKQLARVTGRGNMVECHHDRFRACITTDLQDAQRMQRHLSLARTLQKAAQVDSEQLAHHFLAGGDQASALEHLAKAAERAAAALAFDRAAKLYARALDVERSRSAPRPQSVLKLWRALGDARINAADPLGAAAAYRHAAALSRNPMDGIHAAEALWGTGAIADGKSAIEDGMRSAGLRFPRTHAGGLLAGSWWRARARLSRSAQAGQRECPAQRLRCELCFAIGGALAAHDPMAAYALQGRALYEATRTGRAADLLRALGPELLFEGARGRSLQSTERIIRRLRRAAADTKEPASDAFLDLMLGQLKFLCGEIAVGRRHMQMARQQYLQLEVRDWRYKMASRSLAWLQWFAGDHAAFRHYVPSLIDESLGTGDRLSWFQLVSLFTASDLLEDCPARAEQTLERLRATTQPGDPFGNTFLLDRAEWQQALYVGAHELCGRFEHRLRRTWRRVWRFAHVRTEHVWFSCLSRLHARPRVGAPAEVEAAAVQLLKEPLAWPRALGLALRGACQARAGRLYHACRDYAASAASLESLGFMAQADALKLRSARLAQAVGEEARLLTHIQGSGVANIERWLDLMSPG